MNEIKNNKMENSYLGICWYFVTFPVADYPPPPQKIQISNFFPKTKSEVAEYPPPQPKNCQKSWYFDFSVADYPPPPERQIVRNLGTLTFQLQITPPPNPTTATTTTTTKKLSEILAL